MITKIQTRYTDFYVQVVYQVQFESLSEIVAGIKELACVSYRLAIDQEGCQSIILPSIQHNELDSDLLKCLVIEEGHNIKEHFKLTVIGKNG